jgi:acyl-homoserine lactone acylase PvdQ
LRIVNPLTGTRGRLLGVAGRIFAGSDEAPESTISMEYSVLKLQNPGYRIARWDPVDSLARLKAMAWDLRGNMTDEVTRAAVVADGLAGTRLSSSIRGTRWMSTGRSWTRRALLQAAHLDASRWVQLTGESGHAFSEHYSDQLDLWRTGQTLPMLWSEASIRSAATDTLTLVP